MIFGDNFSSISREITKAKSLTAESKKSQKKLK